MRLLQLKEASTGLRSEQPVLDTLLLSELIHSQQDSHGLDAIAERPCDLAGADEVLTADHDHPARPPDRPSPRPPALLAHGVAYRVRRRGQWTTVSTGRMVAAS